MMWWMTAAWATCEALFPPPVWVDEVEDVAIVGYELASWTADGADVIVEVRARARATDEATFGELVATLTPPPGGTLLDGVVSFTRVDPGAGSWSDDTFSYRFPNALLPRVRSWFMSGAPVWQVAGYEIPTLGPRVRLIDAATDAAYQRETLDIDGRTVWWFASLTPMLSSVRVGSLLMPTPDLPGWTEVSPATLPQLPLRPGDCVDVFPAEVAGWYVGDGANGGLPGEYGVVVVPASTDPVELVRAGRVEGFFSGAYDTGRDGPMDTWVSIADEVAGDGRACVDLGWDSDDDGVIDACTFSGQAFRFESELVPGLNAAGLLAWRGVDGYTTYVFRRGALKLARWTVSTTIHTALNLHGEADVTLPETSIPLLWVPNVPIALIPVGITQVEVSMGLDSALRVEGAMEAGTSWGVVRSDTWRVDHVWREGEGLSVSGSHDVQTRPATDPRIEASAGGFVEAALDASVEVVATESWTRSSLEAGIGAEASLTLDVDPSAVPWWRVGVGTASFAEVELKLAEGLLGTFGVTEPLSSDAETVLEDAGTPFGAAGRDARWIDTVDFEAGSANTSGFSDVAALPGGGVIGIGSSALHAYATRLMPDGSFEWQKRWDFLGGDRSVDALDDGSIVAAFDNCERVFRLAGDGTILWDIAVEGEGTPAHCTVMAFTDPLGVPGILIANSRTIDTLSRPALSFLELDGTVRWSRTYTAAEGATAENGVVLADGHVVLVGGTDVDAHPPMAGYAAATGGGLMMEIDGWGEPLWGVSVNVARFEGVVEGATGDLLAIADVNTYIYQPRHGMGLVSVDRTGALRWATTYAEDVVFEGRADYPLDQTPGDTAWDEASDICALEGGDVLLLGTSSLSTNRAAWMLRTTSDGEPVWFRMHDGPAEDQPRALASLGAGAVAVGWSKSFPGGDSQKGWVARTPAEGGLRHDPAWGWSDRSLQPEVNDLEELVHVLYVDAGGAPVAFGFEDRTTTVDTSPPRPGVPSTPTAERVGF